MRTVRFIQVGVAVAFVLAALSANSTSPSDEYRKPDTPPFPSDNPYSEASVELGRTLFFDPRLSESNFISCASCHNPAFAWGDGMPTATGHGMKKLGRRTPTILNLAWAEALFWDGRAGTLEEQALGPIEAPGEMALPLDQLVARLRSIPEYGGLFEAAYPGEGITTSTIARAIANFERTVVSAEAPFDAWVAGDESAISPAAKRGFAIFEGKGNCAACHSGWRFTDDSFHDIGVATEDLGRGALFEGIDVLEHAFKTPTLRNVDRRAPYMHNGSERSLGDVVDLYDAGGRLKRRSLSAEIRPLGLTEAEKNDLVEFLRSLTSDDDPVAVPAAPQ